MGVDAVTVMLFELLAVMGTAAVAIVLARQSIVRQYISPAVFMVVAYFSTFWLEPLYDWGLYAHFSADFIKLPSWGPFGLAPGGLPLVAGPAYAAYFFVASAFGVALADRYGARLGLRRPIALLVCGYLVGFGWDLGVELIGTHTAMWEFTRVASGFVPFGGSSAQLPLGMPLGMGVVIMAATYLLGGSGGRFLPEVWSRRIAGDRHRGLSTLAVTVVAFHVVMGAVLIPYIITRAAGLCTVTSRHADQVPEHGAPVGTGVFVIWFAAMVIGIGVAVARFDREPVRTAKRPEE